MSLIIKRTIKDANKQADECNIMKIYQINLYMKGKLINYNYEEVEEDNKDKYNELGDIYFLKSKKNNNNWIK